MESFGDVLCTIIENKNVNKKSLCEHLGIDRTLLYRYMANKAVIPEETLSKLINELMLMPSEYEKLRDAYNASLIGMDKYQCRKIIESMFRSSVYMDDILAEECHTPSEVRNSPYFTNYAHAINGSSNVNMAIEHIFGAVQQGDTINIHAQPSNELIMMKMHHLLCSKPDVIINHVFRLAQNQTLDITTPHAMNLKLITNVFKNIFPFGRRNYFPSYFYYYYLDEQPIYSMIHCNLIVTPSHVLISSSNNEKAMILSEPNIVKIYQDELKSLLNISAPFFQILDYTKRSSGTFLSKICHAGELSISPEPMFLNARLTLFRENRINKPESLKDSAIEKVLSKRHEAILKGAPVWIYFTLEGLDHLIQTGIFSDMNAKLMEPMSRKQIKRYLEIVYDYSVKYSNVSVHLVHDESLRFFMKNYTRVYYNSFISITSSECNFDCVYTIHEKSIVQSFSDYFFNILPSNISSESKQSTLEILKGRMDQLDI